MKKYSIVLGILLFAGCESNENTMMTKAKLEKYIPSSYEVVDKYGEIENSDRLEAFKESIERGAKAHLSIINYTPEGAIITRKLEYDGSFIKSTMDESRDASGSGGIYYNDCTSVEVIESKAATEYVLQGCGKSHLSQTLVKVMHNEIADK